MSVQSSLFDNVMTDMSGKIRLDGEDPRWIQLFSLRNVSKLLTKKEVAWYGNRLIENNIMTGNIVQLLDQAATRLQQITPRRTAPPGQLLDQCCSALFISALLLHHLAASLPATEFGRHLFMSEGSSDYHAVPGVTSPTQHSQHGRPSQDQHHTSSVRSGKVLERLVHELGAAIDTPSASLWMQDIKFFSVELLLCCCSTQLYASSAPTSGSSGAVTSIQWPSSSSGPGDVVLNLLYSRAEQQLRAALGVHSSSGAFSACLAVQLVRGLVATACAAESGSAVAVVSAQRTQTVQKASDSTEFAPNSALMMELVVQYGVTSRDMERAQRELNAGPGIGETVQEILIDFLRYLPFGVLHRLFTSPPRPQQTGGAVAAQDPAASVSLLTAEDDADSLDTTLHGDSLVDAERSGADASGAAPTSVAVLVQGAQLLPANPLAKRCLDLLLVLLHNRRSPRCNKPNPFREAFGLLHDASLRDSGAGDDCGSGAGVGGEAEELDEEADFAGRGAGMSSAALSASRINISFTALIQCLARSIQEESFVLLLYSLLQSNTGFTDTLVRTGLLSSALSSCLRGLYELTAKPRKPKEAATTTAEESQLITGAEAKSLSQLYVLVVCALMLVQDSAVAAALCRGLQTSMPWYRERPMESVSLVDASFLCILRCIMHALCRAKDAYLLSNSCAILHNLTGALSSGGLLPYTAERIVIVTVQLCRRAQKHVAGAGRGAQQGDHWAGNASETVGADSVEWALLSEALGTMIQVLESTLRVDRILNNVHLLYALMHEYLPLEATFAHTAVAAALAEQKIPAAVAGAVVGVARHYLTVVETAVGEANASKYSAAQTVQIIAKEIAKEREQGVFYGTNAASASLSVAVDGTGTASSSELPQVGAEATTVGAASGRPLRKRYSYQEADSAEEFFVPAVWTCAIRSAPEIPWQMLRLTLVDPLAAGLVVLRGPVLQPLQDPGSHPVSGHLQQPGEEGERLGAEQV